MKHPADILKVILGAGIILSGLAMTWCHHQLADDSKAGLAHIVNANNLALRYIDADSPPGLLIQEGACSARGVLAREGAPMGDAGKGPCPQ